MPLLEGPADGTDIAALVGLGAGTLADHLTKLLQALVAVMPATTEPNAGPRVAISLGYEFPLFDQSNLCHGTGGNGYAFLKLFARTRDEKRLARARVRHARIGQVDADAARYGQLRCSLWTGGSPLCDILPGSHSRSGGVPGPRCFLAPGQVP
jgi:hypothetical protein